MTWFALRYGVSELRPHADGCTLEVVGKTSFFKLGKEMRTASICHRGEGVRRENEKKRTVVDVDENEKKREKRFKNSTFMFWNTMIL